MVSLTERLASAVKAFQTPPMTATTKYQSPNPFQLMGTSPRNSDLLPQDYGFAQAYTLVESVRSCVDIYADLIESMDFALVKNEGYDPKQDEEIANSADVRDRHRFMTAITDYRRRNNVSLFRHIAYSLLVYDVTYLYLVRNTSKMISTVQWLNPLSVDVMDISGKIDYFQYQPMQGYDDSIPYKILPRDMAYDHGFNPFDDLRGSSTLLAAIDNINISRNTQRFLRDFFANNARPGFIAWLESTDNVSGVGNIEAFKMLKEEFTRYMKGSGNQSRTLISPLPLGTQAFEQPDISKNYGVHTEVRKEIYATFGVPLALAGDTSSTRYKETIDARASFVQTRVKPLLLRIQDFMNDSVLPRIDSDVRLVFDTSDYDLLTELDQQKADMIRADVDAGIISIGYARKERGYDDTKDETTGINWDEMYKYDGVAVHVSQIPKLATAHFFTPATNDLASAEESIANAQAKPIEAQADVVDSLPEPTEKTVTITHGDHDHVIPISNSKAYSHDKALGELKAWRKFRKNDPSRDFEPEYTLGDIADGIRARIADNADLDSVFDDAFNTVKGWQKAIQATRIDFEDSIADIMAKAIADNNYGRQQWSTAMRRTIRSACKKAYADGLVSGGILDGELSEEDENILASHITEQSQYVTNLGEKIFKTEEGLSQALADQKPIMWWNKSVLPMFDAGQLSANENRMMEFAGDDGDESCTTCTTLKGQRHRHKWWARKALRPGVDTDNFECGGWKCEHKLVPVQAGSRN